MNKIPSKLSVGGSNPSWNNINVYIKPLIAGIDATVIFESSPHTMSMLGSLQVVGVLETLTTQVTDFIFKLEDIDY